MAREVVWTMPALEDLEAAAQFIGRDSPSYASAFVRQVMEVAGTLSEMAERGQVVPEIQEADVRELLVRSYRIVYQVSEVQVAILGVIPWGATETKDVVEVKSAGAWGSR